MQPVTMTLPFSLSALPPRLFTLATKASGVLLGLNYRIGK